MSPIIVVALMSLLAITLFALGWWSIRKQAANLEIRHLDVSAFRTLLDRDDEEFLRQRLTRSKFSRQKRLRIRVTWKYVRRIADNSAVVMRETSAGQIADLAAQIRVQCVVAFAKLAVEFAFPAVQLTPALLASKYESLRQNLSQLGSPLVAAM